MALLFCRESLGATNDNGGRCLTAGATGTSLFTLYIACGRYTIANCGTPGSFAVFPHEPFVNITTRRVISRGQVRFYRGLRKGNGLFLASASTVDKFSK